MEIRHRSKSEIEKHRRRISELYLKGWLQEEIASEIGVHQSTVSRDLKAIQKIWQKETLIDFNEAKARELERIDILEREYWEAWERSRAEFQSKTIKQRGAKIEKTGEDEVTKITPVEATQKAEDRNGDPRYLAGVQWCITQRCKILGIEAPNKMEHTGADGGPLVSGPINIIVNAPDESIPD